MEVTLNPGFVCILAALVALAAPRIARAPIMAGSAVAALWLMLEGDFGATSAFAQMGVNTVPLNLDALNRIFGIAMLIALIIIGMASSARRNRSEDAAILLLAGGAVAALFVGDLLLFAASASLAGLAAAWLVFASPMPNSAQSGVRLLIWQGLEGLLFLVGVAFHLAAGADGAVVGQLDADTIGGAFILAALLIRAGAPLAHVWVKDAIAHASPIGAAGLSVFSSMLGVYALARWFPAVELLIYVGMGMIVIGLAYAMAEDDARRVAASGLTAQTGVCVALIGLGSPLSMAAAEGHAFTSIFAFCALQIVLGAILGRRGRVHVSSLEGVSRAMPLTATLLLIAGLAVAGAPLFASYTTIAIALEAMAQWELQWAWALIASVPAGLFAAICLRLSLAAFDGAAVRTPIVETPFPILLGAALASFFCLSVGVAPSWLYGLLPTTLEFAPFAIDRLAPHLALMGAAGVALIALRALKVAPIERDVHLHDVDALYRGPLADGGRWFGVVLLRVYGAAQSFAERQAAMLGRLVMRGVRACDRPYRGNAGGLTQVVTFVIVAAVALVWRFM